MQKQKIDYLRLSITDRCNLNCIYCSPVEKTKFLSHDQVLRYEEMAVIVRAFAESGIKTVRITGGEPLIKKNVSDLIKYLRLIEGLDTVAMTTNGVFLKDKVFALKEAGLDRINISIDTLKKEKYKTLTGKDCLSDVLAGMESALNAGLNPVKLNVVIMKGINDDEILDFAGLIFKYDINVRFIEFFAVNKKSERLRSSIISGYEIKDKIIKEFGHIKQSFKIKGKGPAENYTLKGAKGSLGFIKSSTSDFCSDCNRMRMDCTGRVSPCLFSGHKIDLGKILRQSGETKLIEHIKKVFEEKSDFNKKSKNICNIEMSSIGG